MAELTSLAVLAGFALDLLCGDPHWMYHPVRMVGNLIAIMEKIVKKLFPETEKGERTAGILMAVIVMTVSTAVPAGILYVCRRWNRWVFLAAEIIMCYHLFAVRSLKDESMKVYKELKKKDLSGARKAVSMIVGRDTENLDEVGVVKATVETIAENSSDGIIAPMFYMALGGPVLAWMYKSINTMDSMIGYKNETYINLGRFAARLDDAVNFLPARISGIMMILASVCMGLDYKNAVYIFKRDRYNHASPNSAQTEAVMAGALGIQLAGDAYYFGKLYKKKTIGDALRPVEEEDIPRASRLLYATSIVSVVIFSIIRWGIINFF